MTTGRLLVRPSRMLKKSASFVLASLKSSTYRSVRLASSLTAALLDGLFEHPLTIQALSPPYYHSTVSHKNRVFPQTASVLHSRPSNQNRFLRRARRGSRYPRLWQLVHADESV